MAYTHDAPSGKHPVLTNLPPMQVFFAAAQEQLEQEWEHLHALRSCPVFFNITNFHLYNATYGIEQGDRCLHRIAEILQKNFPGKLLTHLGADHFAVLADTADVTDRIEAACHEVQAFIANTNIDLKAGIRYLSQPPADAPLNLAFDNEAALACKSIQKDATRHYAVYTNEMGRLHHLQNYVRENLNNALANRHIKVYYQPIIHALSGKICGFEALARWESPDYGLLSPAVFIPVLEEARLIDKLDRYIVERVAENLHDHIKQKRNILPISVNLSRIDFQLFDPAAFLEDVLHRYQLARHLLCLEVTENALVLRDDAIRQGLRHLQQAGCKVWLDDFGSGYSSLNVLKDYRFHTLKLDMAFLHPFTKESRTIVASIIRMAKELGIHTLAEGVETKEQAEFLRDIGCEKLQGFYYGRPLPGRDCYAYCRERGMEFETMQETLLLSQAGLIDVNQPTPVSIVYDDSVDLQFLQVNQAYLKALQSMGTKTMTDSNRFLQAPDYPMHRKFRRFADQAIKSGKTETMTYVDNGQYMRVNLRTIARVGHHYIHRAELYNVSLDEAVKDKSSHHFDNILRNILLMFEGIWYLDMGRETLEIIEPLTDDRKGRSTNRDITGTFRHFADYYVHPKDRERFLRFTDCRDFHQRAAKSQSATITEPFRLLRSNGNFDWFFITGLALLKSPAKGILFCIARPRITTPEEIQPQLFEMLESCGITSASFAAVQEDVSHALWQAFLKHSHEKIIWQDRSHCILGVSQSIIDWLGIPEDALIGKTPRELSCCVNRQELYAMDERVMSTGTTLRDAYLHLVIGQMPHLAHAEKFPLYRNDRIAGLITILHDVDTEQHEKMRDVSASVTDEATGFLNYRGMVMVGLRYADDFRLNGDDYAATLIDVPEFDSIGLTYGEEFRSHLLQQICSILRKMLPQTVTISHIGSCCFLLFQKATFIASLQKSYIEIADAIHAIQSVDGCPCTLYMHYATVRGSEGRSLDSLLQLLIKRMHESEEEKYGRAIYTSDRFIFDREAFDHAQLGVIVSDPETYELLYCNPYMRKKLSIAQNETLAGRKCYELLAGISTPCSDCCLPQLSRNRFISRVFHNPVAGVDFLLHDTLIPWHGKNSHYCSCLNLDYYLSRDVRVNEMLFQEASINDAVRLGMYETDPVHGIRQMMARIGRQLEADRIVLAEEQGDFLHLTYRWDAEGILPLGDDFQPVPRSDMRPVFARFAKESSFSIPDMDIYWQENPDVSPHIPGLKRVALARLALDGEPLGYIEAINPSDKKFHYASDLLASLTRFFAILLRNRDMMKRLDRLSKSDQLTGLLNRRGFKESLASLPAGRCIAFIFGDLNGLKETNDTLGHEAGDQLICTAAEVFRHVGHEGSIFRMGGDEFLMMQEIEREEDAAPLLERLQAHFEAAKISIALGCTTAVTPIDNIDDVLKQADALMYRQKLEQHRQKNDF